MADDDPQNRANYRLLGLIAQTLNVPLATFFEDGQSPTSIRSLRAAEAYDLVQASDIIHLFLQLKDPEARERCLGFVENQVEQKP